MSVDWFSLCTQYKTKSYFDQWINFITTNKTRNSACHALEWAEGALPSWYHDCFNANCSFDWSTKMYSALMNVVLFDDVMQDTCFIKNKPDTNWNMQRRFHFQCVYILSSVFVLSWHIKGDGSKMILCVLSVKNHFKCFAQPVVVCFMGCWNSKHSKYK